MVGDERARERISVTALVRSADRAQRGRAMSCPHTTVLDAASWVAPPPEGKGACVDCAADGVEIWSHLRMCLACGHVACCDSTPYRHATAHHTRTGHPVMRSVEPGDDWRWCYVDQRIV